MKQHFIGFSAELGKWIFDSSIVFIGLLIITDLALLASKMAS